MATISITTTQNIELEYELAGLGERMLASLIDLAIQIAYIILLSLLMNHIKPGRNENWLWVIFILPVIFYTLVLELLFNGQTVGKKILKIKVISLVGENATTGQYIIRWLFRLLDIWISGRVLAIITIAATIKHQRLGDLVAGTTLIKRKRKTNFSQTLFTPVVDTNYKTTYPDVIHLSDSDIQLVKEVLLTVRKSGNTMLALELMRKIETLLNIKSQHEPLTFLYALLSDYNHLANKL